VKENLYGLENLSLIPGTVGAAPVQNIGAYGAEVKDTVSWVEVFNQETGELETLSSSECDFGYRDSMFKKPEGKKYIITRVAFLVVSKRQAQYKL
jgi:UDP-N-acetylmuramate dehydrogenase